MTHDEAKRKNIPTAEYPSVLDEAQKNPKQVRYPRNTALDPQLVWRGKDEQDWSDLVVHAPPLYIQEKAHYNLDMVLALGFRVRSPVGVRFRQWANGTLKEYIVKFRVLDNLYFESDFDRMVKQLSSKTPGKEG